MKLYKYCSFWFTLFAVGVCLINMSGLDDKNLLLFLTSPPLVVLDGYASFLKRYISQDGLFIVLYICNIGFWLLFGFIFDGFLASIRKSTTLEQRKLFLKRIAWIAISLFIVAAAAISFYLSENSERKITKIINHPDQYSSYSVQYSMNRAADSEYAAKVVEPISAIAQATTDEGTYSSAIYALSNMDSQEAVRAIVLAKDRFNNQTIAPFALRNMYQAIVSMLEAGQPDDVVEMGMEAARLFTYEPFIALLQKISDETSNSALKTTAESVIDAIKLDPIPRNPKIEID